LTDTTRTRTGGDLAFDVGCKADAGMSRTVYLVNPTENFKRKQQAFRFSRLRLAVDPDCLWLG
jgi:hypothetical protein